ncbi:hypothetical protein FO440_20620 [Mucilaginibacter corticis]|uniref:UPF0758 domain-containing protein n=1 Tax=Mucilaginibacter corticis TaxID=2597670 RepID=A0A556MGH7_9SPHI|nr:UPF0758 domain-containing protein [Mucilaginibacter corticis]TSJ38905.1 hypothetical protein FO440_20620 [Mucilaginibacter corticis]
MPAETLGRLADMERKLINIKDLSVTDRPREKCIFLGAAQLTNAELLAILLGSGSKQFPLAAICDGLIDLLNNDMTALCRTTAEELSVVSGIGVAKAVTLLAAVELGKRSLHNCAPILLKDDAGIVKFIKPLFDPNELPQYYLLLLNNRSELLATCELATIAQLPDVKQIMKLSLEAAAFEIVLCRNNFCLPKDFEIKEADFMKLLQAAADMLNLKLRGLVVPDC